MSDTWAARINALAVTLTILALWQALFEYAGAHAIAPPIETASYLLQLLSTGRFWMHLTETARAFAFALAISVATGLFLGLSLGLHRFSAEVGEPILVSLYSVPKITLYPIVLLAFGLGMPAKVAFGAIHGIIPVAIFTMNAVRTMNPILVRTARAMKLGNWAIVRTIVLPAAMPEIFTGLRVCFSLTLIGTLLGEMFGSQRGLGYLLMQAIGLQNVRVIMAVTLLLVLFAASVSAALIAVDRRLHRHA